MYNITKEKYRDISGFIRFVVKSHHEIVKAYYDAFMMNEEYIKACEDLNYQIKMFQTNTELVANKLLILLI